MDDSADDHDAHLIRQNCSSENFVGRIVVFFERLAPHRDEILKSWCDDILGCYPEEGARHFKNVGDSFANPIGVAVSEVSGQLFDSLVEERDLEQLQTLLDRIIRPRAIQDLSPSQAVGFIYRLKGIVQRALENGGGVDEGIDLGFRDFSDRIDRMGLVAFDVFMKCREDVFSIRLKEVRSRSLKAFERLNEWQAKRYETR